MRRPYHIYAPEYTEQSAGAKALHFLARELSAAGETITIVPFGRDALPSVGAIAIYPEIIVGNPLGASRVVRWLLYYAGRYRGNHEFPHRDKVWGYTTRIARAFGTDKVLFLPTIDEKIFVPPTSGTRAGACFYAHKYRSFYGKVPDAHGVEITNPGQSREEIIRLFQTSEVFYTYEDTALTIEAALCGCPVVCLPSEVFPECCGLEEFNAGIAWGVDEITKAQDTVRNAHEQYAGLKANFKTQLSAFIQDTQTWP